MNNRLPALPEPFSAELFHADQMRAYAELAIASVKREPQWLPIKSAPQTSDEILVISTNGKRSIQTGLFVQNMTDTAINNGEKPLYTLWMHIPPVTATTASNRDGDG